MGTMPGLGGLKSEEESKRGAAKWLPAWAVLRRELISSERLESGIYQEAVQLGRWSCYCLRDLLDVVNAPGEEVGDVPPVRVELAEAERSPSRFSAVATCWLSTIRGRFPQCPYNDSC